MYTIRSCLAGGIVFLALVSPLAADDWPMFRGPLGNGISAEAEAPTTWRREQNVAWKVPLPRPGNGSPIVSAGKVLLASAEDEEGKRRSLYCFDRLRGEQLWVRTVDFDQAMPTHKTNPYCASTPASDGRRVVVWHGSAGLHCYDHAGNPLWSRELGEFRHMWGYASSPVIWKDRVFLYCGPGKEIFVAAFDLLNGKTLWQTGEPQDGNGQENSAGKYMGSWTTPIIFKSGERDVLLCSLPTRVVAYDPESGEQVFTCDGLRGERGDLAYSSPMVAGSVCVAIGGFRGPGIGFRLGGQGDISESHRLWRNEENPQSIGSGVFLGEHIFRANAGPGTIDCLDAATGKVLWSDRAAGADHWASVVFAGGRLYATNQNGTTVVFVPNSERFESIETNKLEETTNATPAISGGQIFIRTFENLYCIGRSDVARRP